MNVVPIVEGDGEVTALPALLRRFSQWRGSDWADIVSPIRVRRDRFLNNAEEFSRKLTLAGLKCQNNGWILILLDADDDCPLTIAEGVLQRAQAILPQDRISVVVVKHEYEAWLIAAAPSLAGRRGFSPPRDMPEAESIRGAKEWIGKCLPHGQKYHEVSDQAAFSAVMDLQMAYDHSRSFRKLAGEWDKQMALVGP